MKTIERTRQQLDPVGSLGSRLLSLSLAWGAFLFGLVMTIRSLDQISNLMLAVLALFWLAAATLVVTIATSPGRAPFTQSAHLAVQLLALGAVVLSVASQWGTNRFIQDDFGSMSLGLLMLALGPYRPATELAAAGGLSAVFVGFITLMEVPYLDTSAPPVSFVLVGMTPILALSFASASFSGGLVDALERWQRQAQLGVEQRRILLRDGITRSVQRDRVMILSKDVLPFFNGVLERDTVDPGDRERARDIADAIRALMVAEADRTWLEVVAGDDGVPDERMSRAVVDKAGKASLMVTDQRTALRALIVALTDEPSFVAGSMRITITGTKSECHGTVVSRFTASDIDLRAAMAPYLAVLRIVFASVHLEIHHQTLTLRFSYEQR
ncbi:MAG: hypothetical protein KF739_12090 [Cryobacterium sp.]|nr:hypothetical protein [Cryobacterium sp.]